MRLDDSQIERYSRQIVLPEIGAEGQYRLLESHVAVVGTTPCAAAIVDQLAAGGVGAIATSIEPQGRSDAQRSDSRLTPLDAATGNSLDILALIGPDATSTLEASHTLWLADGRIGETPCARCSADALAPAPACAPELLGIRDALLGALVATEIIKRLVGIGTPLHGKVLTYDPATASVTVDTVAPGPACTRCTPARRTEG